MKQFMRHNYVNTHKVTKVVHEQRIKGSSFVGFDVATAIGEAHLGKLSSHSIAIRQLAVKTLALIIAVIIRYVSMLTWSGFFLVLIGRLCWCSLRERRFGR